MATAAAPAGNGLFFGLGTGRCATMTLANALNSEERVACLHEGQVRAREEKGEQWLPYLTLQNLQAYLAPAAAPEILRRTRGAMPALRRGGGVELLGDIAYNYSPFVVALRCGAHALDAVGARNQVARFIVSS